MAEAAKVVEVPMRDYEQCVNCGHIIGWHFESNGRCEHRTEVGQPGDCHCYAALCDAEAEAIKRYIAENKDMKYIRYMTGLKYKTIQTYTEGILHLWNNGKVWVPKR